MSNFRKIALRSGLVVLVYLAALYFFPHSEVGTATFLNRLSQIVLFFVSAFLFRKEPIKSNRFIFLNFLVAFLIAILNFANDFVGIAFFSEDKYANILFWQYASIAFFFFFSLAIVYLVIDSLFHERKTFEKYSLTFGILFLFFGYFFTPYIKDSMTLYQTEDILQWKALHTHVSKSASAKALLEAGAQHQLALELANNVRLQSWQDAVAIGDLYPDKNFARIEKLVPYLEGDNYMILVLYPLYRDIVQINALLVFLIVLFFGYQYTKDPPQGAYIDKIMFIFLLFCSMEILHNWAFIKSLEWRTWNDLGNIGQYVTVCIEALMVLFFALRLRFITSVQGEFYETELATNPHRITRWRDWLDNLVLSQFFNFKIFNGRMFQDPSAK